MPAKRPEPADAERRIAHLYAVIAECALRIAKSSDLESILEAAVPVIREHIGLDRVGFFLYDEVSSSWTGVYGTDEQGDLVSEKDLDITANLAHPLHCIEREEGSEYFIEDYENTFPDDARMKGVKENFVVALRARGRLVGAITCDNLLTGRQLTEAHREDLKTFGQYIAMAIENRRLLQDLENMNKDLLNSEARYMDLFDNAPDSYFLIDAKGNIRSANRWAAGKVQFRQEELVGSPFKMLVHPGDAEKFMSKLNGVLSGPRGVYEIPVRQVRRDGIVLEVNVRVSVQESRDGGGELFRVICRDITEQRAAERREKELRQQLARNDRLASLANLAGGVAPDLNNILSPLIAYPDLIMASFEKGSAEYKDLIAIKEAAKRAVTIVGDLLSLAGQGRYELQPLDLNDIVAEVLSCPEIEETMQMHPAVRILHREGGMIGFVPGSAANLRQAIINTVRVACLVLRKGEVSITLEKASLAKERIGYNAIPPGAYAVTRFDLLGASLTDEDRERIFEPFYTKIKMNIGGTGLELSNARAIIKDHHGFIDVVTKKRDSVMIAYYLPVVSG
ncbi:MAG: PAS domain S-box protein [Verrucomicrobia bacterium]|nr:PAS domain S-box protein [Verrucomicrobiota bacterium]